MRYFALSRISNGKSAQLQWSGLRLRKPLSTTTRASLQYRKWTADEDSKIIDLRNQKLPGHKIASQLEGRSPLQVLYRLRWLRNTDTRLDSSKTRWSRREDEIMAKKRLEGLQFNQIQHFLPGRSWLAIATRYRTLSNEVPSEEVSRAPWTEEERQSIIDMKVKEGLSTFAIAQKLKRRISAVQQIWNTELRTTVPNATLEKLRPSNGWTAEQDQLLKDLHKKGLPFTEMQVPGKSLRSIYIRGAMLSLPRRRRARPSPEEAMAIRRALEPVLAGKATIEDVQAQFPGSTRRRLSQMLMRLRKGYYRSKEIAPS